MQFSAKIYIIGDFVITISVHMLKAKKSWRTIGNLIRELLRPLFLIVLFFYIFGLILEQQWPDFFRHTVSIDYLLIATLILGLILTVLGAGRARKKLDNSFAKWRIFQYSTLAIMIFILVYRRSQNLGAVTSLVVSLLAAFFIYIFSLYLSSRG